MALNVIEDLGRLAWAYADLADRLAGIIEEYADHQSVRCGWPAGYGQWKDGDCACGLTRMLREAGLPVEWAGGPPED